MSLGCGGGGGGRKVGVGVDATKGVDIGVDRPGVPFWELNVLESSAKLVIERRTTVLWNCNGY